MSEMMMTDEELYGQLRAYLEDHGRIVEDVDRGVIEIYGHLGAEIDPDHPLRLHVTPRSLGEHLRAGIDGPSSIWPDVDPLVEQWRLFLVHIEEAVETAGGERTELVLDRFGVAAYAPGALDRPPAQ